MASSFLPYFYSSFGGANDARKQSSETGNASNSEKRKKIKQPGPASEIREKEIGERAAAHDEWVFPRMGVSVLSDRI